jgi:hypothetical protein
MTCKLKYLARIVSLVILVALFLLADQSLPAEAQDVTTSAEEKSATQWVTGALNLTYPHQVAAGRIHGRPFKLSHADFDGQFLHLVQGNNWISGELCLAIALNNPQAGKAYLASSYSENAASLPPSSHSKTSSPEIKAINLIWKNANGSHTTQLPKDYAMRLHFFKDQPGYLNGYIFIRIDDGYKSEVAGYFQAIRSKN